MSDIFREVDEDVQRDKVENFWKRYQTPIFVVAGLIVAATGAWSYYTNERTKAAEAANASFMAAVADADAGKTAEAVAAFEAIAKSAPKGYATLARLRGAEALAKTDKNKAIKELDALAEDKTVDSLTREVAELRSALYVIESGDRERSMMKLGPLITANGAFRYSAQEWTGLDALLDQDYDEAERVFSLLLNDRDAPAGMRQRAQAYQGLLHAARGIKKPQGAGGGAVEEITGVTPIIEPADGESSGDAPTVVEPKK
jgi:hypothetical protein